MARRSQIVKFLNNSLSFKQNHFIKHILNCFISSCIQIPLSSSTVTPNVCFMEVNLKIYENLQQKGKVSSCTYILYILFSTYLKAVLEILYPRNYQSLRNQMCPYQKKKKNYITLHYKITLKTITQEVVRNNCIHNRSNLRKLFVSNGIFLEKKIKMCSYMTF